MRRFDSYCPYFSILDARMSLLPFQPSASTASFKEHPCLPRYAFKSFTVTSR